MSDNLYLGILFGVIIGFSVGIYVEYGFSMTYPPSPAFSKVFINDDEVRASIYNDVLNITTEGMITTEVDQNKNTVIMKLQELTCPALQAIIGIDSDGNLICDII